MNDPAVLVTGLRVTGGDVSIVSRTVPEEVPVALVYDGSTHAVMMATPADLKDFAVGFSLTEGLIEDPTEIAEFETVEQESGFEARMWLVAKAGRRIADRRRSIAGPTGCGLCGVESLEAAVSAPPQVSSALRIDPAGVQRALTALTPVQELNRLTRAVHAAAFWTDAAGIVAVREDVGRHTALDKLAGALTDSGVDAGGGVILLTSRVSVEMVQKSARIGSPVIIAVSAPTSLAIRTADAAGITLIAIARGDSFEVFTHPARLSLPRTGSFRRAEALTHAV